MTIRGQRQYLWRAVDQEGEVIDILLQPRRDRHAAARFFRKLLKRSGRVPHCLVTDRLGSYRAAHRVMALVHESCGLKRPEIRIRVSFCASRPH